jgi:hypothetical protein
MRRRAMAAAWAKGLSSLVKGTGANIKIGDILINVFYFLEVPYNPIVYQTVKYYISVI